MTGAVRPNPAELMKADVTRKATAVFEAPVEDLLINALDLYFDLGSETEKRHTTRPQN